MRSTPEVRSFYTQIAGIGAKRNWLWLDFLTVGGRRIAFDYCLHYRNKQYLLKTGYDPQYARYSPYHLLLSRVLQTTFENRLAEFDFLGINDSWKQPWTRAARPHYWLYVFPNDTRMRLLYGIKFQMLPRLKQHRFIAALGGLRADRRARDEGN